MNKAIILIACALIVCSSTAYGATACMSNKNKYRTFEYVTCYCPCKEYKELPRGQCSYCCHYRYPDNLDIKDTKKMSKKNRALTSKKIPHNVANMRLYQLFGKNGTFDARTGQPLPIVE
jgi:hypothetical protein